MPGSLQALVALGPSQWTQVAGGVCTGLSCQPFRRLLAGAGSGRSLASSPWSQEHRSVLHSPESHPCLSPKGSSQMHVEFYCHGCALASRNFTHFLTYWMFLLLSLFSPLLVLCALFLIPIRPDASLGLLISRIRVSQSEQTCTLARPMALHLRPLLLFPHLRLSLSLLLYLPLSSQIRIQFQRRAAP